MLPLHTATTLAGAVEVADAADLVEHGRLGPASEREPDAYLTALLRAAMTAVEAWTGAPVGRQESVVAVFAGGDCSLDLAGPYMDDAGIRVESAPAWGASPGWTALAEDADWRRSRRGVRLSWSDDRLRYRATYMRGWSTTPPAVRLAVLTAAAEWYTQRVVLGPYGLPLPLGLRAMLAHHRQRRM